MLKLSMLKQFGKFLYSLLISLWFYIAFFSYVVIYGSFVAWRQKILSKTRGEKAAREYLINEVAKFGRRAFSWFGIKVICMGEENVPREKEGYVIIANHLSTMDIPLILGYVNGGTAFIAKAELSKVPGVSHYTKKLGGLFIKRGDPKQTAGVLRVMARAIRNGKVFTIFPEGTRSRDGKVGPFRKGSLAIPYKLGVKVLPVSIYGTGRIMKPRSLLLNPTRVGIHIHPMIDPADFGSEEELREKVREVIVKGWERLRKEVER